MTIATRFSIAVHVLMLLDAGPDGAATSEWMAASVGVNPVTVRTVVGLLRRAGIVHTQQGVSGARLARPLAQITLLDVYRAVERTRGLFSIHAKPNPACPVGANIQAALEGCFSSAQAALEATLEATNLQQVLDDVLQRAGRDRAHVQTNGGEHP